MIWDIIWVTVVTLIFIALVRWGARTPRRNGVIAISVGALFWGFVRYNWIDFSWFLFRPLGGWWFFGLFILFLASLLLALVMWRDPKWLGWLAVAIAVLAPFWDLFTTDLWGDLWPDQWDVPGSDMLWVTIIALLLVALLVFLLLKSAVIAGLIVALAVVLAVANVGLGLLEIDGFNGRDDVDSVRESVTEPIDKCIPPKGVPETVATEGYQGSIPENYTVDSAGFCVKDEPTVTPPATSVACPPAYRQHLDPNWKNRYVSEGVEGTAAQKRLQHLKNLREDYRYLHAWAEYLFQRDIVRGELVTAGKRCLTERGQDLYKEVKGALMASGVRTGAAPATWYNTGMQKGKAVVSSTPGIRGDRTATIYTLRNGTKFIVLDRCGNMALPSKPPNLPPGKTDNPGKPKPPREYGGDKPPTLSKTPGDEPAQQGNVPTNVTGRNPGTNNEPASAPKAKPPTTYTPPPPPTSSGSGTRDNPPPPPESNTPSEDPAPTQDPCSSNPDFC